MSQEQNVEQRSLHCAILGLPAELLCEHILSHLNATSLVCVEMSCRFFRVGTACAASLPEQAAYRKLSTSCGNAEARQFQLFSWKQRLWFEENLADFDVGLLSRAGVSTGFSLPDCEGSISTVAMKNQLGPKLLVSSLTTLDRPLLKWRLRVTGNAAVEFGVVPSSLAKVHLALHKGSGASRIGGYKRRRKGRGDPIGFCSLTTGGSTLPFKAAVNEGCIVEIEAHRDHVHYLITNPPTIQHPAFKHIDALPADHDDERQHDSCSVSREVRLQHAIFPDCAYRLAATCWANAQLEVVPRFSPSLSMQDHNLDSCFDGCHQIQSGHVNTAMVMPGGSVSQTGLM